MSFELSYSDPKITLFSSFGENSLDVSVPNEAQTLLYAMIDKMGKNLPLLMGIHPSLDKLIEAKLSEKEIPSHLTINIPMSDFCAMVKYGLQNTDLYPNDPRIELLNQMQKAKIVEGFNRGRTRIDT
jgi:hypothetical protein